MKTRFSIAIAAVLAVGIGAFFVGHATDLVACDNTRTAQGYVNTALAAMPADAHACCKSAVATAVTAGYNACTAGATKTAGAASCCASDKTAAVTTAAAGTWVTFSMAALPADAYPCCKNAAQTALTAIASACSGTASVASCSKYAYTTASGCSYSKKVSLTYAEVNLHEGRRLVLTGNAVCSKCTFKTTESCSTLFQTADGNIYRLIDNNMIKGLRAAEDDVKITTTVRKIDGVKYLEVETFKAI
ncbi:MAG: hypothetical protein O7D32_09060 [bacterium]|nr:hypothetical protein [bacterium]